MSIAPVCSSQGWCCARQRAECWNGRLSRAKFLPKPTRVADSKHSSADRRAPAKPLRASGRQAPTLDSEQLYTAQFGKTPRFVGPIRINQIKDHGLGFVATRDISVGELILTSAALAIVYGTRGVVPETDELARLLKYRPLSAKEKQLLEYLHDGVQDRPAPDISTLNDLLVGKCEAVGADGFQESPQPTSVPSQPHLDTQDPPGILTDQSRSDRGSAGNANSATTHHSAGSADSGLTSRPLMEHTPVDTTAGSCRTAAQQHVNGSGHIDAPAGTSAGEAASAQDAAPGTSDDAWMAAFSATSRSAAVAEGPSVADSSGLSAERLRRIATANCYGEAYEDIAVCQLRQEYPESFVGLWPEASFFNHSCAPNAVQVVFGELMMVRAVNSVAAGEQLTISYLGESRFAPVGVRQRLLAESYGFQCRCERCSLEERHFVRQVKGEEELSWWRRAWDRAFGGDRVLLQRLHWQYGRRWENALHQVIGLPEEQERLSKDLRTWQQALQKAVTRLRLTPREELSMKAAVWGFLRLCQRMLELERRSAASQQAHADFQEDLVQLRECVLVADAVARGSDKHLFLALEYMGRMHDRHGKGSEQYSEAERLCYAAHIARYGLVSRSLLKRLMLMRQRYVVGSGIVSRLGLYGWDDGGDPPTTMSQLRDESTVQKPAAAR